MIDWQNRQLRTVSQNRLIAARRRNVTGCDRLLAAASGNLLYSLRSPSPAVLSLRVTIRSARTVNQPLSGAGCGNVQSASRQPFGQGFALALTRSGLRHFLAIMKRWRNGLTGNRGWKKGVKSDGGKTSHHVTFYLLPRRYAPRLQCSNERTHFIFRYDKRKATPQTLWHLSS